MGDLECNRKVAVVTRFKGLSRLSLNPAEIRTADVTSKSKLYSFRDLASAKKLEEIRE